MSLASFRVLGSVGASGVVLSINKPLSPFTFRLRLFGTGLPWQQNRLDNAFRFKRAAFYMGLKSKVGLVAAKSSVLRINLNIQGCSVVAPSLHAPSHALLLLPLLLSHNIPLPRGH